MHYVRHSAMAAALFGALMLGACSDDPVVNDDDDDGSSSSTSAAGGAARSTSVTQTSTQATTTSGMGGGGMGCEVPTTVGELQAFLAAGTYQTWTAESGVHGSTGPHFGNVLTFVNDELFDSLTANNPTHPVCAASVKELYGQSGNTVRGYSVMVKVTDGQGGDTWYWYEDFDGSVIAEGVGNGTCTGCHSSGPDFFRTPFPLQ